MSVLSTMEVLVAAVVAWLLLGEELAAAQLAGGAVLLTGVVIVQLPRPQPRRPRQPAETPALR